MENTDGRRRTQRWGLGTWTLCVLVVHKVWVKFERKVWWPPVIFTSGIPAVLFHSHCIRGGLCDQQDAVEVWLPRQSHKRHGFHLVFSQVFHSAGSWPQCHADTQAILWRHLVWIWGFCQQPAPTSSHVSEWPTWGKQILDPAFTPSSDCSPDDIWMKTS